MPAASKPTKAATNGAGKTNLDELLRARREHAGVGPVVVLGGEDYQLPASLPASVLVGIGDLQAGHLGGLRDAIGGLFGAENVDRVLAAGFDIPDFEPVLHLYGEAGFLPASGISS